MWLQYGDMSHFLIAHPIYILIHTCDALYIMASVTIRDGFICLIIVWWILTQYMFSCCDEDWLPDYKVKACFKLYDNPILDWNGAKQFCHRKGSFLSDLADFTEQKFVNTTIIGDRYIRHGAWLGGNDIDKGVWRWVNDSRMNIDLFLWRKGNPDNGKVIFELGDLGEDCLEITTEPGYRGQLNDYKCREKMAFVCKSTKMFKISTTTAKTAALSTVEIHRPQKENETSNAKTIVMIVSLALILVIAALVIVVVSVYRNRRGLPNLYADTSHITTNEHLYTGLDSSQHVDNSGLDNTQFDNNANTITFEHPGTCMGRTDSQDYLLQSQCSEPNIYESLEDSLNTARGASYPAMGSENESISRTFKREKSIDHLKAKCTLDQANNSFIMKSYKCCSGYLDMDTGYYIEVFNNQHGGRGTEYVEPEYYVNRDTLSQNTNGDVVAAPNASLNDECTDGHVENKAISERFNCKPHGVNIVKEHISAYYLTPVHGNK